MSEKHKKVSKKSYTIDDATLKEIDTFKAIHRLKSSSEALRGLIAEHKALKEQSLKPNIETPDKKIVEKALGLQDYPKNCKDMLSIQGQSTLRECVCPNSLRPIGLPQKQGKFIVENPQKCWRCRALGYRKVKQPKQRKRTMFNGGTKRKEKVFRGNSRFSMGDSEGISMFDIQD